MPCLMTKPVVDELERDLEGQAQFLRLNVMSDVGREVALRHGVQAVPTTLLFDGEGQVIHRSVGPPDRGEIRELVAQMAALSAEGQ